jgi:energy-coupling factor transport system ATP-binding protein
MHLWKRLGEIFLDTLVLVELKNITVTPPVWGEGKPLYPIVKDVTLTLRSGEWVTLVGSNGSGKSTLAKAIAGWRLAGMSGSRAGVMAGARSGKPAPIVMQRPEAALIGATPWEDVVLLLEQNELESSSIIEEAERALALVGLGERMHQPLATLSGGQKQLVAIAGSLAMQSPLLVLDEATAMLDPEASAEVLKRVRELQQGGVSVLWITQRLEELAGPERLLAMDEGRIVYDGRAEQWYEREQRVQGSSCCERLGFTAPYTVKVAWELELQGVDLYPLPCTPESLAEAVSQYGR